MLLKDMPREARNVETLTLSFIEIWFEALLMENISIYVKQFKDGANVFKRRHVLTCFGDLARWRKRDEANEEPKLSG
jgi:hypothetical protein